MAVVLRTEGLTKSYGRANAVDGVSLAVEEGEIFGFVGPNGAGKTTTIRMLATLLLPSAGDAWVAESSVRREPRHVRRLIGYMPDFFGVYSDMRVWEYLDFFAACYRLPQGVRPSLVADLLQLVDLSHRRDDWVDQLSRGMKQRLSLARALIHDPQVLLLDEPASGLDPRARVEIRELLVELARMGKTIFFSTHILSDVAQICTRIGVIEAGRIVALGTLESLRQQLVPVRRVLMTVLGQPDRAIATLSSVPGISQVEPKPVPSGDHRSVVAFRFAGDDDALSSVLTLAIRQDLAVLDFREESGDLEEVFLSVTKGLVT